MEWTKLHVKEKIQLTGACLFLLTLPYSREINQLFMVIFILTCALNWNRNSWNHNKKTILIFISIYLVSIFSCFYDPDILLAYKKLEVQLTLLLVPLFFGASYRPTIFKNNVILTAFITGVCSALVYLLAYFIIHMHGMHLPLSEWLKEDYLNHHYSAPIDIHAGFFSCYVSLCLFTLIIFLVKARHWIMRAVLLLLIMLCLLSLFLLTSRSVLILTFICLLCLVPFGLRRLKWYFSATAGLAIAILLTVFVTKSSYFEGRFTGQLEKDVKLSELTRAMENHQSLIKDSILQNDGARIERWVASWELIKKRPLLGYGTGEEKPELFKKYKEMGLTVTLDQHYDSHNQFISYTIKSGILGFLAFTYMLAYAFIRATRTRNFLYICFLILVIGTCLIDTFLEVNKGIFFFAFFNIFLFMNVNTSFEKR